MVEILVGCEGWWWRAFSSYLLKKGYRKWYHIQWLVLRDSKGVIADVLSCSIADEVDDARSDVDALEKNNLLIVQFWVSQPNSRLII